MRRAALPKAPSPGGDPKLGTLPGVARALVFRLATAAVQRGALV